MPAIKRGLKYKKACLKNNFKSKIKLSNATYDTSSAVRCRTLSEPFRSKDTSSRRLWRLQWTQRETKLEIYIDLRKNIRNKILILSLIMTCFDKNYRSTYYWNQWQMKSTCSRFKKRYPWKKVGSLKKVPI